MPAGQVLFTLSEMKGLTTFRSTNCKKPFLQFCMLLLQFTSIHGFYSMWELEGIVFYKRLSLSWGSLQLPSSCFLSNKWFERSPYFIFLSPQQSTMPIPEWKVSKQSSKMKFSYIILVKYFVLLLTFDAPLSL